MPKVSVIIPTYNRAPFITQALESVFAQTFKDFEIIVVDDGSTDNTQEVLKKFDGRIISILQENQGISPTRNRGIKLALGQYIAFLDSDDFWTPEKLEDQVKVLYANPKVGIVYSRMPIINAQGVKIGMKPSGVSGRNFRELLEVWGDLPTSTVMVRRECFDKAGFFDPELQTGEDIELWIRIARHYDLHEIENKIHAYYRRHEEQITKSRIKVHSGLIKIYTKIYNDYPEASKGLMRRRIVESQYSLSKDYLNEGKYNNALMITWRAIVGFPLLGGIFINKGDNPMVCLYKFIKPYGLLVWIFLNCLAHGFQK